MPRIRHSTLSANTLFHFTKSRENLIGILQNEFYPRYALENWNLDEPDVAYRHIAIPMVSFCDIPLSHVKDHVEHYGEYALGLTKDWAKSKGIAPVLYTYPSALTSAAIVNLFRNLPPTVDPQKFSTFTEVQRHLVYFSFYVKRYEGQMYRNGAYTQETVRFYDEREWRYLPPRNILMRNDISSYLPKTVFDDQSQRNRDNDGLARVCRLGFEPKSIKYVIVRSESEILDTVDAILRIKGRNFPYDEVRQLTTRIISMEQILEDF